MPSSMENVSRKFEGGGSRPIRGQCDPGLSCSSAMRSDRNLLAEVFSSASVFRHERSHDRGLVSAQSTIDEGGCGDSHSHFRELPSG